VALVTTIWSGAWELSMRRYLEGFSDAIVSAEASPQQKGEAILAWMRNGPARLETQHPTELSARDPQDTLNYGQLLEVCGSATNAFLNLARSAGLNSRRLLLLSPEHTAKHVVAELEVDRRWVIVDPAYRAFMKDAQGNLLTRKDLQNPEIFREATSALPGYLPEYTYERFAHVRLAAFPFGAQIRHLLESAFPTWEERLDWTLLLERRSFMYLFISIASLIVLALARGILGWYADHHLKIPRFHLRANVIRAMAAFFTTPEIK
jgi:Transglutaminase-like superfamily